MTIRWLLLPASALPEGDGWLGFEERKVLASLPEKLKKYKCDAAIVTSGC